MAEHDMVVREGRVIDPPTGTDAVLDVGVDAGRVTAVSTGPLAGRRVLDAGGAVVAPGFVDLHSHCDGLPGLRLQVLDGVTTALELEAGVHPVSRAYARAAAEGRPTNYGFSTSWSSARMAVLAGLPATGALADTMANVADPRWQTEATTAQVEQLIGRLEEDLAQGALGIGVLVGYAPRVSPEEYLAVAAAAARAGRPTFTHARDLVEQDPTTPIDGAEEIVRAAGETGAHMHYCHVNSTSLRHVDRVLSLVDRARRLGSRVSTEAYPYGSGMTGIGAAFLAPESLARRGLTPHAVQHLLSGRRMGSARELAEAQATRGGEWAFVHFLDEDDPHDRAVLRRALLFEDTAIASDAIEPTRAGAPMDPAAWPLAARTVSHPRTAGTFSRTLRTLVREGAGFTLVEAVRRCSTVPADVLAADVPAMARKGRVQPGADADLVVFDPDTVTDNATYASTVAPSTGVRHVLVNGEPVVRDGELDLTSLPGRPVRA